jgi:hypothetical protein
MVSYGVMRGIKNRQRLADRQIHAQPTRQAWPGGSFTISVGRKASQSGP